jgi:hypothetical protein
MNLRLLPVVGLAGFFSIALAGSVAADGWPPAPGNYRLTDIVAGADLSGPPTTVCFPEKGCGPGPSDFAYVTVDRGLHTFTPRGNAPLVQQNGTMLNLFLISASGASAGGCWIISDSDFVVASDLSTASLSTTVPAQSNCPGTPLAVSATNLVTAKGGGGGGGGSPITLNVRWTSKGVVAHARDDGMFTCGSFTTVGGQDLDHASASSQGEITGASETLTSDYAGIERSSSNQVVKGVPADACF